MIEMNAAREIKVEANKKILLEVEQYMIQALKNAGKKL